MRLRPAAVLAIPAVGAVALLAACGDGGGGGEPAPLTGWAAIRAAAAPVVALPGEFGPAAPQALATDGWEDGICISRDGLHLFAVYAPADLLSFTIAGGDQTQSQAYLRGPTLGMDLGTIPAGLSDPQPTTWLHGDIVHASRTALDRPFGPWQRTTMSQPVWSEGAPQPWGAGGATWDCFAYTTNQHPPDYKAHIGLARNAPLAPTAAGTLLPAPVTTSTTEDNPHLENLGGGSLVLFFDSGDRLAGHGLDIWYTTSADDGVTWAAPVRSTSLDTDADEHQPHLWRDGGGIWWIYFSATNPLDGKLGIFRARQQTPGDWDSWTGRELVIGAGNTAGVGEPTLTTAGDLSFVVVIEDAANGTATDRFDADPWFTPRRPGGMAGRVRPPAPLALLAATGR